MADELAAAGKHNELSGFTSGIVLCKLAHPFLMRGDRDDVILFNGNPAEELSRSMRQSGRTKQDR